jgi:hypothetical protein
VRVYAAGDLAVAYLQNPAGKISDRVLCWPEKKRYGRVYGGGDGRIQRLLEEAGFKCGELEGARLLKVRKRGTYVMPYIDNYQMVSEDADYFRIGDGYGTAYRAENTHGLIGDVEEEDNCYVTDLDEYRSEAWVQDNCTWCEQSEAYYYSEEFVTYRRPGGYTSGRQYTTEVAISWARENAVYSEHMGEWLHPVIAVELPDGTHATQRYIDDNPSLSEEFDADTLEAA